MKCKNCDDPGLETIHRRCPNCGVKNPAFEDDTEPSARSLAKRLGEMEAENKTIKDELEALKNARKKKEKDDDTPEY